MSKFYFLSTLIISFFSLPLLSQVQSTNEILNDVIKKKAREFENEINFKKAQDFFIEKNWDSTLIYSLKQIKLSKNKELQDYLKQKNILSQHISISDEKNIATAFVVLET